MSETGDRTYLDLKSVPIANGNKNKIIDASVNLFSQRGYNAVSIRDITREVGIKESSFYNHFGGKEELLETIFFNFRHGTSKILPPAEILDGLLSKMGPGDFLKRGYANFKENIEDKAMEKIWRILFMELFRNPMAREIYLQDILGKTLSLLEIVFGKYIAAGRVKPSDPRILAAEYQYPLFAMISEYVMQRIDHKDTAPIERAMTDHIEFFLQHIIHE